MQLNDSWPWACEQRLLGNAAESPLLVHLLDCYQMFQWEKMLKAGAGLDPCVDSSLSHGYACALMAAARMRTEGAFDTSWERAARRLAEAHHCDEMRWILETEWAAWLMGLGNFEATLLKLRQAPVDKLGLYVASRVHTVRFVCLIYLGQLSKAKRALRQLEGTLTRQEHGRILLARCQLMLFLETEEIAKARRIANEFPLFRVARSSREYNLQIEQIRFHFYMGENEAAYNMLAFSEKYSSQLIADVHGERRLREDVSLDCLEFLNRMLKECEAAGSTIGICDTLQLIARWHVLNQDYREAERHLARLSQVAERSGFVKALCRGRIVNGIIRALHDDRVKASQEFRAASHLAERSGYVTLGVIARVFLLAVEGIGGRNSWIQNVGRLVNRRTKCEYLNIRKLFPDERFRTASVRVLPGKSRVERMSVLQLCDRVIASSSCCVLRLASGELLLKQEEALRSISLSKSDTILRALGYITALSSLGFGLEGLARAVWGIRTFQAHRHAGRSRALLLRVRSLLKGFVSIEFDASRSCYRFVPLGEFLVVMHHTSNSHRRFDVRTHEILEIAREEGCVRVGDLEKRLGLTRQALHRYLQQLVGSGHLIMNRRGRSTSYSVVTE